MDDERRKQPPQHASLSPGRRPNPTLTHRDFSYNAPASPSPGPHPLGDAIETFIRREDIERLAEEVRADDPALHPRRGRRLFLSLEPDPRWLLSQVRCSSGTSQNLLDCSNALGGIMQDPRHVVERRCDLVVGGACDRVRECRPQRDEHEAHGADRCAGGGRRPSPAALARVTQDARECRCEPPSTGWRSRRRPTQSGSACDRRR